MSEDQNIKQSAGETPQTTEGMNENLPVGQAGLLQQNIKQPQATDNPPQTENMEVHKHPHHVTHKKKWGEYLLEFFMLFLAVFFGFIAENIREEKADEKKEKQYMRYMIQDLEKDTAALHETLSRCATSGNNLDMAVTILISADTSDSVTRKLYSLNLNYLKGITVIFSDRTSSQLKNAGAMRLIKDNEVLTHLFTYWSQAENLKGISTTLDEMRLHAREATYGIFNTKYYLQKNKGDPLIADKPVLITNDFKTLTELANRLEHIKNLIQNVYIPNQKIELAEAEKLMEIIKNEYHIKNE
jgi:hypothetical protein